MNTISIVREEYNDKQTIGQLFVLDEFANVVFKCFTLELPWRDNQNNISCIPEGRYKIKKRYSQKFGNHIHILKVPDRTWILIHEANYARQLRGCIAVGKERLDLDGDGNVDVTSSVNTKLALLDHLPDESEVVIGS